MQHRGIGAALVQVCWIACSLTALATDGTDPSPIDSVQELDFAHEVLPILRAKCAHCHSNGTYKGGFSLDTREVIVQAGVVATDPDASELLARLHSSDPELRMPKEGSLDPDELEVLTRWVRQGLPWQAGFSFRPRKERVQLALTR